MINVILYGVDEFLAKHIEERFSPEIARICEVNTNQVILTCVHSMIYHGGVDQTSFHMQILVELNEEFREFEEDLAYFILKASKEFSVHAHLDFKYVEDEGYERIDENYPLYISKSNEVSLHVDDDFDDYDDEDNEDEEVDDIFASFKKEI